LRIIETFGRILMNVSYYVCGLREWARDFDFRINPRVTLEEFLFACNRMYFDYSLTIRYSGTWINNNWLVRIFRRKVDFEIDFGRLKLQVIRYQFYMTRSFLNKKRKLPFKIYIRIYLSDRENWYKIACAIF